MNDNQIVYALANPAMPDISLRMGQLYSTGVPVPFECVYAVQVDNCIKVEAAFHIAFGPYRINPNHEFFKIEPEQVISMLKLLGPNDATDTIRQELDENVSQAERDSGEKLKKRPNMDFHQMGIANDQPLYFVDDPSITVTVSGPRKVIHNGNSVSLTAATRAILNLDYSVQPSPKWKYNGKLLKDIYEEVYSDDEG